MKTTLVLTAALLITSTASHAEELTSSLLKRTPFMSGYDVMVVDGKEVVTPQYDQYETGVTLVDLGNGLCERTVYSLVSIRKVMTFYGEITDPRTSEQTTTVHCS